ncbi:MAG: sensor histidine kinase [Flavobacteriaceae bacterium]|nr:sensor histidine kinase [Flavobacteriaceae bacterium]
MLTTILDQDRLRDKVSLTLRVSYFSSIFSFVFGLLCIFLLDIYEVVPYIFIGFGLLNLLNTLAYKYHKNLTLTYNVISITGLISSIIVTLFTGGINSAFIFVLAVVVFAGYTSTRNYGKIYLYISILLIILIYIQGISEYSLTQNVVPATSQNLFSFLSILFSVYLLGGVLGKNLLRAHHNLYKTKHELELQIKEKETLLKEVHHRVKNNLQTVSSLLSLQARSISDPEMRTLIKSSQNRVISMAMVHEMLYMREDISKIEYKSYVQELGEYLLKSVKGATDNVSLQIDIPDIQLGIDTAIPLGLLINETITNALKYGIKDEEPGEIHITLRKVNQEEYILMIGDDGVGYPDDIDLKNSKSLGLKLIHNLARQLKGSISRDTSKKGTNYILEFREIGENVQSVI